MDPIRNSSFPMPSQPSVAVENSGSTSQATLNQSYLPNNWEAAVDRESGRVYYKRNGSNHTQWERPRPLLPGWAETIHPQTQGLYYYNTVTRRTLTTGERPENQLQSSSSTTTSYPGYTTGPFVGPSITPPSQIPGPPIDVLTGQVASLQIRSRSPFGFEQAIRARLLNSARTRADTLLGRRQPVPGNPQMLASTPQQSQAPARNLNIALPLHDSFEGREGALDSISSWVALSPYHDLSTNCDNLFSKMAFNIINKMIDDQPLDKQVKLCQVLVNDAIKQMTAEQNLRNANAFFLPSEPSSSGKLIRATMEILAEKDANVDIDDYRFSDLMQRLENFRREKSIDYSTSWGEEDV